MRRANKLLENIYEVAREIADGLAIDLKYIVDTIDERYRQEAIKKALKPTGLSRASPRRLLSSPN